jgi:hypothetical protein
MAHGQPGPPDEDPGPEPTRPVDAAETTDPKPDASPDPEAVSPSPAEAPEAAPPAPPEPAPGQPTAEEVLRAFEQDRPKNAPLMPVEVSLTGPNGRQDPLSQRARARYPDGYMLADRAGRISRENQWFVFTFESTSTAFEEPPLKLLPNLMLERAAFEIQGSPNLVFVVSGEITDFNGENYLLLRKLLRRRQLGNLRK